MSKEIRFDHFGTIDEFYSGLSKSISSDESEEGKRARSVKISDEAMKAFRLVGESFGIYKGLPRFDRKTGDYIRDERTGKPKRNVNMSQCIEISSFFMLALAKAMEKMNGGKSYQASDNRNYDLLCDALGMDRNLGGPLVDLYTIFNEAAEFEAMTKNNSKGGDDK